jgi:NADH-quinone oxidoreductase subunit J
MLILFLLFAAVAIVAAFNVILQRNPIYSAIALVVTLVAQAALFLTLAAQMIAAFQIIVYAGAIMVLFVFVIMLLNVRVEDARVERKPYLKWLAIPLFVALLAEVYFVVRTVTELPTAVPSANATDPALVLGSAESIGNAMFTNYLLPFEVVSILILMAIVGAMYLAQRDRPTSPARVQAAPAAGRVEQTRPGKTEAEEVAAGAIR